MSLSAAQAAIRISVLGGFSPLFLISCLSSGFLQWVGFTIILLTRAGTVGGGGGGGGGGVGGWRTCNIEYQTLGI